MKRLILVALLALMLPAAVACNQGPGPAAPTQPAESTVEVIQPTEAPPTVTVVPPTEAALPTVPPEPTAEPTATLPPPPTAEPTLTPEPSPTATAEPTATPEPTAAGVFAPGQQDTAALPAGGFKGYLVNGRQFIPTVLFVEPDAPLDIALASFAGDQTAQATLEGLTPLSQANFNPTGRPEVLVLSPDLDGQYTMVVSAAAGEGGFTAYLYDLTSPAAGMAVQQADSLAAGETKSYTVTSNGVRPVLFMVDPTDRSDLALTVIEQGGAVAATADFSGPGSVETAFVLPLGTTSYTLQVVETNGAPSSFNVAIVTLE